MVVLVRLSDAIIPTLWNGYIPALGTIFDVIDYTGILTGAYPNPGGLWSVIYNQNFLARNNTYSDNPPWVTDYNRIYLCYGCGVVATPEPTTYALLAGCLTLAGLMRVRSHRKVT